MNSRERIMAVLAGEKPDMTPIFPKIAFANVLACEGMTVREYMTDPKCMAAACVSAYRKFGWDGVALHTDISSEGKALGTIYEQPENLSLIHISGGRTHRQVNAACQQHRRQAGAQDNQRAGLTDDRRKIIQRPEARTHDGRNQHQKKNAEKAEK